MLNAKLNDDGRVFQVFHVCHSNRKDSFFCPGGTSFNQRVRTKCPLGTRLPIAHLPSSLEANKDMNLVLIAFCGEVLQFFDKVNNDTEFRNIM